MSILTIVYAGEQVYNAEVESFGFEANAKGDLFVTASTEPVELDEKVENLDGDDRLTPFEQALMTKRAQGNA